MSHERQVRLDPSERRVMDVVHLCEPASADAVRKRFGKDLSYPAVKALLDALVAKGHLAVEHTGKQYLFRPTMPRPAARRAAMSNLLASFFDGSTVEAVATLIDLSRDELSETDLAQLSGLIEAVREEAR